MNTPPLPFSEWKMPTRQHAEWLRLANAAPDGWDRAFPYWKSGDFYPLKTRLLRRYAAPDGADLQVLALRCRSCVRGTWISECGRHRDLCWHCDGTGLFRTDVVVLKRWEFAGSVFHEPTHRVRGVNEVELVEWRAKDFRGVIEGKVTHEAVPWKVARVAWLRLLWVYERPAFWAAIERMIEAAAEERIGRLKGWADRLLWRAEEWLVWSESRWAEGLREWFGVKREDQVPF